MKQLTEYSKNGYEFKLVKREGQYAIFLGTKENSISQNYEVIKIQSDNGGERFGRVFDPSEFPPSNNQWGTLGWTYGNSKEALAKFNSLVHP